MTVTLIGPANPNAVDPHAYMKKMYPTPLRFNIGKPTGTVRHFISEVYKRRFYLGDLIHEQATRAVPVYRGATAGFAKHFFKSKKYPRHGTRECARRAARLAQA